MSTLTISDQLRRAAIESGLSARGLATRAGVPASAVVRFLGEQRDIQLGTAAKLCEALGLKLVEGAARPARKAVRRPATRSPAKGTA